MARLKVANLPTKYVNGSPGTRAFNVLAQMGMRDIQIDNDDDDGASLTYELPSDFVDPMDIEDRLHNVGLIRTAE